MRKLFYIHLCIVVTFLFTRRIYVCFLYILVTFAVCDKIEIVVFFVTYCNYMDYFIDQVFFDFFFFERGFHGVDVAALIIQGTKRNRWTRIFEKILFNILTVYEK